MWREFLSFAVDAILWAGGRLMRRSLDALLSPAQGSLANKHGVAVRLVFEVFS